MNTNWTSFTINEVCDDIIDCVNKTAKIVAGPTNFKMIRTTNIKSGWIDVDNVRYVTEEVYNKWTKRVIPQLDDIILTREAPLGEVGIVRTNDKIFLGQRTILYRAKIEKVLPQFLYYLFQTELIQGQFSSFGSGSTVEHIRIEDCKSFKILLPTIDIQKPLATILSNYDNLIDINNQRIKLLNEAAKELYKEWFVRIRFPGYKSTKFKLGIPKNWEINTCYSFADVKGGGTPATTNPVFWDGKINFFTPTDHSNSFFIMETEKKITEIGLKQSSTKLFPHYSTFVTARGTVGNICLAGEQMAMNQSCFGLVAHSKQDYFFTFLFTDIMVKYLKQVASGATFDAITLNTFKNYKAPIPDSELRVKFNDIVTPMFLQIENLILQNTQLRQIRDRLLPRLISGKLKIKAETEAVACP